MAEAGEGEPVRCNCGFWGSPQTDNMCSKCYKAHLSKVKAKSDSGRSGEASQILKQLGLVASTSNTQSTTRESTDGQEKLDNQPEGEKKEAENKEDPFLPAERPKQKNKKKCWICKSKLELAQRELGLCKCGYVFCLLHRLPEQHECIYNHKEGGRQQDMKVMVPASKKKIGRSFHRMDSRPE